MCFSDYFEYAFSVKIFLFDYTKFVFRNNVGSETKEFDRVYFHFKPELRQSAHYRARRIFLIWGSHDDLICTLVVYSVG